MSRGAVPRAAGSAARYDAGMGAMRSALASMIVVLGLGCGGHGGATPAAPGGATSGGGTSGGGSARGGGGAGGPAEVTPAAMCARIFELKQDAACTLVQDYDLTREECEADYRRSLEERGDDARAATLTAGHCLLDQATCGDVAACLDAMTSAANNGAPEELRRCEQTDVYAPVAVSADEWAHRKGAGVRFFREVQSTKDDPVEVCGIPAEMTWLLDLVCQDGSNPYGGSYERAHASRAGNVGAGGVCGSIIDLYEVPCPEGTYEIYMDAYVCPAPAGMAVPKQRTRVPAAP